MAKQIEKHSVVARLNGRIAGEYENNFKNTTDPTLRKELKEKITFHREEQRRHNLQAQCCGDQFVR